MKASQRGVALIVVLLILAMMATIAATMSERLFTQFKRSNNQINYQQAYWYAVGAEAIAIEGIEQSYEDSDTINLSQPWALDEQTYPLDFGTLTGRLVDKQACYNLNALAETESTANSASTPYLVNVLQELMKALDMDTHIAEVVSHSSWEYVDTNNRIDSVAGVEDSVYESMSPAYMAANGMLADASELRAVYQVSGDVMTALAPYVCALPTADFRLNVNTLQPSHAALLSAMFLQQLSLSDAEAILNNRPYDGWSDIDKFFAEPQLSGVNDAAKKQAKGFLGVDSAYFELDAQVVVQESRVRIRSLLHSDNRETATVVRRRFGGIGERVPDRSAE